MKLKKQQKVFAIIGLFLFIGNILPSYAQNNRFEVSKQLDVLNAIVKEVEMFYVDTVDVEKTVRKGINAMLSSLDPYTEYYPEEDMDDFKMMTTGEYGGMGSYIRQRKEGGGALITEPFEGMPAALAGLKAGDYILAIDTVDVSTLSSDKVSETLKGVPNTMMKLKIQRPNEDKPRIFNITRKKVVINQVTWYGVRAEGVGYIALESFTDKSADEVRNAFIDLKENHKITSLILDLRSNGGGLLNGAVDILSMFLPKGTEVLSTRGKIKQYDQSYKTASKPLDTKIPLVVLINGHSASASEIVAGALQDTDRAIIIGQRSFGKGLVQSTRNLPYDGKVKVTMSKYYIPSGRCIQQMDYSHRKPDGSVAAIPDSLTSIFYTSKKRPVRDGGGIRPDFEVKEPKMATLLFYLATGYVLFDFVTDWVQKHPTIAPIEDFNITDEDFDSLKVYAKEQKFSYDRQSEKVLKSLKEIAEFEGYLDDDSTLFDALESKLKPNIERDFDRNKTEIKKILAAEIVKRYYYQKGELLQNLKDDKCLEKAIAVLKDEELYNKTLKIKE